jgi:hypothetical protein
MPMTSEGYEGDWNSRVEAEDDGLAQRISNNSIETATANNKFLFLRSESDVCSRANFPANYLSVVVSRHSPSHESVM